MEHSWSGSGQEDLVDIYVEKFVLLSCAGLKSITHSRVQKLDTV